MEGNNYYEKIGSTIQLMPEIVDGFRHLTKNIYAISIATRISWVGPTREINYFVGLHISVFTLTCRSLTHRHCPYCSFPPIVATVCGLVRLE